MAVKSACNVTLPLEEPVPVVVEELVSVVPVVPVEVLVALVVPVVLVELPPCRSDAS